MTKIREKLVLGSPLLSPHNHSLTSMNIIKLLTGFYYALKVIKTEEGKCYGQNLYTINTQIRKYKQRPSLDCFYFS